MRIRNIKLQIWLSETEAEKLERHASKAKMSKSAYVRAFINGYAPKEQPPFEYYQAIRELRAIGNNINQIAHRINGTGEFDAEVYEKHYKEIISLTDELTKAFLPTKQRR